MTGPVSAAGGATKPAAAGVDPALAKAAHAFEAVFLRQMIGSMRTARLGGEDDALFDSKAADQFRDMGDARLADDMAGKFGIAELLMKQYGKGAPPPAAESSATP